MKKSKPSNKLALNPLPPHTASVITPLESYPRPKGLITHACLQVSSSNEEFRIFRNKRIYYGKIRISQEYNYSGHDKQRLFHGIKLLKYPQSLELCSYNPYCNMHIIHCWQRLTQVKKISILIDVSHISMTVATKRNIEYLFKILGRETMNLSVKIQYVRMPEEKVVLYILDQLTLYLRTLTNLENLTVGNIKRFYFRREKNYKVTELPTQVQMTSIQEMQNRISRLTKIRSFSFLNRSPSYYPLFDIFFHHLHRLENLHNLEFCSLPPRLLEIVRDKVAQTQSVSSIVFYHHLEPQDALFIASTLSSLEQLTIRDDWYFENPEMPILASRSPENINVTSLHLDSLLPMDNKEDIRFFKGFLSAFPKLKCLHLYLISEPGSGSLFSGLNDALRNHSLQELVLGLDLGSGRQMSEALEEMKSIATLRKLSLTIKSYRQEWKAGLNLVCPSIKKLLSQNKQLKEFELFVERITSRYMEQMKELFESLNGLDSLTFTYAPLCKGSRRTHTAILEEAEQMLMGYNASERIIVQLQYSPEEGESCEGWQKHLESNVKMGKRVRQFNFMCAERIHIPFYNEYLSRYT